jgi:hypothetical protein
MVYWAPLFLMTYLTRRPLDVIAIDRCGVPCRIQKPECILYSQALGLVYYRWMFGIQNLNLQDDYEGLIAPAVPDVQLD